MAELDPPLYIKKFTVFNGDFIPDDKKCPNYNVSCQFLHCHCFHPNLPALL